MTGHALAILMLLPFAGTIPPAHKSVDTHMPGAFMLRVAEYVEIHRRVAAGIGDPQLCGDVEEAARQSARLAAAIRDARPMADEGDIFTPDVAAAFRARIAYAIRTGSVGMAIIRALPELPPELEYHIAGRNLMLRDIAANLVVDVLREALPPADRMPAPRLKSSCDVHPDIPACRAI
jgi:hypothetical protein